MTTKIEWVQGPSGERGETWNPLKGCRRISPGCGGPKNEGGCYAERQAIRFAGLGGAYEGLVESTQNGPRWTGKAVVDEAKLVEPLGWRKPRTVFVDSMSDLFFEGFKPEQIARAVATMARTPHVTYQVLTKRAERMAELLASPWFRDLVGALLATAGVKVWGPWPLPNVWWGVSCENRRHGLPRLHHLRRTPAAVRFVSFEPLLEDVTVPLHDDIDWLGGPDADGGCRTCGLSWNGEKGADGYHECPPGFGGRIHWAIIGGESGPRSRPCDLAWIRALVVRCRAAGVAPFVKQLGSEPVWDSDGPGGVHALELTHKKGANMEEWPLDLRVREMPERPAA